MGSYPPPTQRRELAQSNEEEFHRKYPGLISYKQCIGRAYGWGLATFAIAFSSSYFSLKALTQRLKLDSKYFVVISSLCGCLTAYHFTKERSRMCHEYILNREGRDREEEMTRELNDGLSVK